MYYALLSLVFVLFLSVIAFLMTERGKDIREFIHFFATGMDSGFKIGQILFLGKIGRSAGLENLTSLFWSLPALDRCTAEIVQKSRLTGTDTDLKTQVLLSRLYAYRTKIELEQSRKKKGLETTKDIQTGQRIRILVQGVGVFSSKVLKNTARALVLDYPSNPKIAATAISWIHKTVSIYFWRQEDAGYTFDTVILPNPEPSNKAILHVAHSAMLERSQKRKSVRVKCSIYAQMFLIKPGEELNDFLEAEAGMKCLIEDLSEDGAMIIIGGKAKKGLQIKLQFVIHDIVIVMPGTIRAMEFNEETNQSRIHLESIELNQRMRNAILTFVYNVLPEAEKEKFDAIMLSEEDGKKDSAIVENTSIHNNTDQENNNDLISNFQEDLPELPDFAEN